MAEEPVEDPASLPAKDPAAESAPDADDGPDCPLWAASAGRHAIHIPSARIRRIRQKRLFIPVLYAEESDIYNLIAAATCQLFTGSGGKERRLWLGAEMMNHVHCRYER
jgi:hypothetical protein